MAPSISLPLQVIANEVEVGSAECHEIMAYISLTTHYRGGMQGASGQQQPQVPHHAYLGLGMTLKGRQRR